jgi:hypothetical protein
VKEKWTKIPGTKGEFFRCSATNRVRHKSELWKEEIWNDDWKDVPGYEGLYRMCVFLDHPIIFSIKRDVILDVAQGAYTLSKDGIRKRYTVRQILDL